MRKKTGKSNSAKEPQNDSALTPQESSPSPSPVASRWSDEDVDGPGPDPDELLQEALAEPNIRKLETYSLTIHALREKGYSFREIATWLNGREIDANYNSVYRVYVKGMTHEEEENFELAEAEEYQQEDDMRNR